MKLQIINNSLLKQYLLHFPKGLQAHFEALHDAEVSTPDFSFYISVASVFSSKIEGEAIELDSYIKYKRDGISFLPDYTKKIDDLYSAYLFAMQNAFNEKNVKKAHKLLSKHLLTKVWQGKYRSNNMYVATDNGRIEYVAALPDAVPNEMKKFFNDIKELLKIEMTFEEVFYFASMIHLVFVKIHTWNDGNGRTARLLEKWFLSEKLGLKAWFIQSEKMYYRQHQTYYGNIRLLGLEYDELDYEKALPFLIMLPKTLLDATQN